MTRQGTRVAAIALAAGTSRRMGTPKQLLRLGDKSLLERTLDNVRGSGVDEIVLVLGAAEDEVRRQVATEGMRVVVNPDFQQGMGTSLRRGLAAVSPSIEGAFVVLADQPFVRSSTLDQMLAYREKHAPQILIPFYRGFRGNPVLLDRSVFPELMNLTGDIGCRAIFGSHTESIHKLPVEDPGILLDIDSAEDWKRLRSLGDALVHFQGMPEIEVRPGKKTDKRPELVVVGHDPMARALATLARIMEFSVTIVGPLLSLDELPEADRALHVLDFSRLGDAERYVVVASRGQFDEEAVEQAVRVKANYIALMANRQRAEEIFRALLHRGVTAEELAAARVPAGLDIGAESVAEIALSIMAEIVKARRRPSHAKG
ncbi:MAG TPA: NTP transferase domain-containing protein [Candidatus Angelobacter sp.]|nr:NTP transferase domain-containing protein [Candidatus Angelobacter sp.]